MDGGDILSHIKRVVPQADYKLEIMFENGSSLILNMENKLGTVRFGMLSNKEFFQQAITDGNYVKWDNKIEISASEVFQLAQK